MRIRRIRHGKWVWLVPILLAGYWGTGCTPADDFNGDGVRQTIVISAAASTQEPIEELAVAFERSHAVEIKLNLGSSSSLASQIIEGAPADLLLSANEQWAEELAKSGLVAEQTAILTNRLVIVTPKGNPAGIRKPEDLLDESVSKIALAGEKVPAGQYADQALTQLNLLASLIEGGKIVRGQDVRSALAYVARGEVEAGVVYATDAAVQRDVEIVCELDPALHDNIIYVLVLVKRAGRAPKAAKFYAFLRTGEAQAEFKRHGFSPLPD